MSLILRETIEDQAVETGKQIQAHIILNGYQQDDKIKELVQPLIESVVEMSQREKQQAIDEYMGQQQDEEEEQKREKRLAELKADVADTVLVDINKRRKLTTTKYSLNTYKTVEHDCVDDITYEDLLDHPDADDEYYDDFRQKVKIKCPSEFEHLVNASQNDFMEHIKKTCKSVDDIIDLSIAVNEAGILKYSYYLDGIKQVCEIIKDEFNSKSTSKRKRDE